MNYCKIYILILTKNNSAGYFICYTSIWKKILATKGYIMMNFEEIQLPGIPLMIGKISAYIACSHVTMFLLF